MVKFQNLVAFRLALICGGFVVATTALLSTVFYFNTIGVLTRNAERKISTVSARLVDEADREGLQAAAIRIQQYFGDGVDTDSEIFLLTDSDGRVLTGNISALTDAAVPDGQVVEHAVIRVGKLSHAHILLHRLSNGALLVVGRDMSDLNEIRGLISDAIVIGGLLALLLSVFGTLLFHRKIEGRILAIRHAAGDIEMGNLSRRISVSNAPDEFDRLSADINHMLDRIETLMDGVRYVSNVVAHNLRTPLGRIRGHLEHALRGKSNYQGLEDAGNYAIEEIDSLTAVLEKLLQIGEAESGTRRRPFESVNLGELVTLVVELYDAAADAQGISLIADVGGNTVVFGDKDLLAIILGNLLDNALKYAGNCATITVRVSRERETVTLVVQDGGPGIPLQEREKVLRRFYRLDNRQLGNGLGLSIVVAFTFLHGGTIQLEDAAPGLRVRITLPFAGVLVSEPD